MYYDKFPSTVGQIYDEVKLGVEQFSPKAKMNIFRPNMVKDMNYFPGCHEAFPTGRISILEDSFIKTLHFRNLGIDFVIERNMRARKRNSQQNKEKGWGVHVEWSEDEWRRIFEEGMQNAIEVI